MAALIGIEWLLMAESGRRNPRQEAAIRKFRRAALGDGRA
jgi:hypothetical protein